MNRNPISTLLALVLAALPLSAQGQADFVAKGDVAARLAKILDQMAERGFRGAAIAAKDGKVLIARGRGGDDLDAKTIFEIASTTKQFTAAAILKLQEKGKLELDDAISKHLPNVPESCAGITVRHLVQHTSGIPGSNSRGGGDDLAAVVPMFLDGGPKHEPGTHFEYWNQGYALLAGIIERASGMSYMDFCKKELFKKAKMKGALFTGDKAPSHTKVAVGKSDRGDRSALAHPYGRYGYQYKGMGGVVCSVWDLWHWDRALASGKVLKKSSLKEFFTPGLEDYALGWRVHERNGRLVQEHGGDVAGFHTAFARYPDVDACLVLFIATDGQNRELYVDTLERALFGEGVALPEPLTSTVATTLVGQYQAKDGAKMTFLLVGNDVYADFQANGQPRPSRWSVVPGKTPEMFTCRSGEWEFSVTVTEVDDKQRVMRFDFGRWRGFERTD